MKPIIKKILRFFAYSFLVLVILASMLYGAVAYILYHHENELAQLLVAELNHKQVGETRFGNVKLSIFKNLPYISIDIEDLEFYADKSCEGEPIYAFKDVYVGFDVYDLLRKEYTIKKIKLSNGHLFLEKNENGDYNLLLAKASEDDDPIEQDGHTHIDLRSIVLSNVIVKEKNIYQGEKYLSVLLKTAKIKFSYIGEQIVIKLDTDALLNEYSANNVKYFRELPFGIHSKISLENEYLTIDKSRLDLRSGFLEFDGNLDIKDSLNLAMNIYGRKKNFDVFFSLAPPEIFEKLDKFRNEGDIYFKGTIAGKVEKQSPQIMLELGCQNTNFYYTGNNKSIKDVSFKGFFQTGKNGSLEDAELFFENIYGVPEDGLFKGAFRVKNFINPEYAVDFHADFDLENLQAFYKLDFIEYGKGNVKIDISLREYADKDSALHFSTDLKDGQKSNIKIKNLSFKHKNYPLPIEQVNAYIVLDGDDLKVENFTARAGESDFKFNFKTSNLSALVHHYDKSVDLTFHGEAKKLNLGELLSAVRTEQSPGWKSDTIYDLNFDIELYTSSKSLETFRYLPETKLYVRNLRMKTKKYPHEISNIYGYFETNEEEIKLKRFDMKIGRNNLAFTGFLNNIGALMDTSRKEQVAYSIDASTAYLNLKELLVYDGKGFIADSIEEEVLHDSKLVASGTIKSNSFTKKGFISKTNIQYLNVKINDLPRVEDVRGEIMTDTSGCITISNFHAKMGRSNVYADLKLNHYLDKQKKYKNINGKIRSDNLDFDQLLSYNPSDPSQQGHDTGFNVFSVAFPKMNVLVEIKQFNHHKYLIKNFRGRFRSTPDHYVYFDTLSFDAAEGSVVIKGYLNGSNPDSIYLNSDIDLNHINLSQVLYKFDNFGQDMLINDNINGILSGKIKAFMRMHPDLTPDLSKSKVNADVSLTEGRLMQFAPIQAMADFMGNRNLNNIRFDELNNNFTFENGTLTIPQMKIASTLGYLYISGRQRMDSSMDYQLRLPLSLVKQASFNTMRSKLSRSKNRNDAEINEIEEEIISSQKGLIRSYINLSISGTSEDYKVRMGKSREKNPEL
jgi:hypothetical protein